MGYWRRAVRREVGLTIRPRRDVCMWVSAVLFELKRAKWFPSKMFGLLACSFLSRLCVIILINTVVLACRVHAMAEITLVLQ